MPAESTFFGRTHALPDGAGTANASPIVGVHLQPGAKAGESPNKGHFQRVHPSGWTGCLRVRSTLPTKVVSQLVHLSAVRDEQTEQYIDWRLQVVDAGIAKLRKELEDLIGARKRWLAVTGGRSKINGNGGTNGTSAI